MKFIKYLFILIGFTILFTSCSDRKHKRRKAEEISRLEAYIDQMVDDGYWVRDSVHETETGLRYIRHEIGDGTESIELNDEVFYRFKTYTTDGDTLSGYFSYWYGPGLEDPFSLVYLGYANSSSYFPNDLEGFVEGIATMKGGDFSSFLIPSTLGYGQNKTNGIPGYTTFRVDVKVTGLKKAQ